MTWQPIETAPKDGEPVLLFAGLTGLEGVLAPTIVVGYHLSGVGWVAQSYKGQRLAYLTPTHWMALPDFPEPKR